MSTVRVPSTGTDHSHHHGPDPSRDHGRRSSLHHPAGKVLALVLAAATRLLAPETTAWAATGVVPSVHPSALRLDVTPTTESVTLVLTATATATPVSILRAPSLAALRAHPTVEWTGSLASGSALVTLPRGALGTENWFFVARWEPAVPNPSPQDLVWIPPGSFLRGSPGSEAGRQSDEGPVTQIVVSFGFFIGKREVTQGDYVALMDSNPSARPGDDLPVHGVSWLDASTFCDRLNARESAAGRLPTDHEYRLPTESEWEFAARAGTTTRFSYGDDLAHTRLSDFAWHDSNAEAMPHPGGLKEPNRWGLHDIHGNLAEWCLDFYAGYLGGRERDPRGPDAGEFHVLRGGSYLDAPDSCRSACRRYHWTEDPPPDAGLRVVLAPRTVLSGIELIDFVEVPAGEFLMGSPDTEAGHQRDEEPFVRVTFPRAFHMSRHEVTQAQYEIVVGTNPSMFRTGQFKRPVENVTWDEAVEFCRRLTELERAAGSLPPGMRYRLPTEAEWEYAARAGTTNAFHFADTLDPVTTGLHAWHLTSGNTFNVGSLFPNPWGLFDMHGNVAEWCQDRADLYAGGSAIEPSGPSRSPYRVARGGGFSDEPRFLRSAVRWSFLEPATRLRVLGFRIVRVLGEPPAVADLDLVALEPGTFQMGSPATDGERSTREEPASAVTLTRPYWMSCHEITQGHYLQFMGANPSYFNGPMHRPVERVRWQDAMEFCRRLTESEAQAGRLPEGLVFRLPTEAEWEYAARAGTISPYATDGQAPPEQLADFACFLTGPTCGVGSRLPNHWGLHDLPGNVHEWCLDNDGPYSAEPKTDPLGPSTGALKVIRGGSWDSPGRACRSAARDAADPNTAHPAIGFRVVLGHPVPSSSLATESTR